MTKMHPFHSTPLHCIPSIHSIPLHCIALHHHTYSTKIHSTPFHWHHCTCAMDYPTIQVPLFAEPMGCPLDARWAERADRTACGSVDQADTDASSRSQPKV